MRIKKRKYSNAIKIIAICLVFFFIGYAIGYATGVAWGLNWSVEKAIAMMDRQGIKIEFNSQMISKALWQYKNTINGCLFTEDKNASIFNDTRNQTLD